MSHYTSPNSDASLTELPQSTSALFVFVILSAAKDLKLRIPVILSAAKDLSILGCHPRETGICFSL